MDKKYFVETTTDLPFDNSSTKDYDHRETTKWSVLRLKCPGDSRYLLIKTYVSKLDEERLLLGFFHRPLHASNLQQVLEKFAGYMGKCTQF